MYLSKIDIFGFKSFASKTKLVFNDGVTAIVGPNGCGKTNIVDALRWVLGEQRYSTLRSDKMEDVIFNGTKYRKPIGLAEVSLTIQNTKGILPMEYSDVTITRRLFRSGESEYLLNKTVCRLKDIVSLFMDTGMGANAYSVIELKMVESILSDKTDERRHLFEEAAGVTKYKAKRKEAFRRLEDVQSDLLRVNDIIAEVEKTVASLERQAKKAEKYKETSNHLRVLEIDVLERDYSNLFSRLEPLEARLIEAQSNKENLALQVKQRESLMGELQHEERDIEQQLDLTRAKQQDHQQRYNDSEQKLLVNIERRRSLEQSIERWKQFIVDENTKQESLLNTRQELLDKKLLMTTEVEKLSVHVEQLKTTHEAKEYSVTQRKLEVASLQQKQMDYIQLISQHKSEMSRLETNIESLRQQLRNVELEQTEHKQLVEEKRVLFIQSNQGEFELKDNVLQSERTFREMEEKKQVIRSEIDSLQNRAFEIQNQIGEKMTKIDFLNSLVDRLVGYSESVQYLLSHHDWSPSKSVTVADVINTRAELRPCIESALGDATHYIIVNDIAEAVSGIQRLRSREKGKATFVCLSKVPGVNPIPFPIAGNGITGWAIDHIQHPDEYSSLFRYLFRNVLIVQDNQTAHACIREYPQLRCVTIEGDVFQSEGIVRGGNHRHDEGVMIGKREQITDLNREVNKLKKLLEENQHLLQTKNQEYGDIDLVLYADQIKQSQQRLSSLEKECAQMVFEIEKYERTINKLATDRQNYSQSLIESENALNALRSVIDAAIHERGEFENTRRVTIETLAQLEREYAKSMSGLNEATIALVQKSGELQNCENEIERVQQSIQETTLSIERTSEEIHQGETTLLSLSDEIDQLEKSLLDIRREKIELDRVIHEIERQLRSKREEIDQFNNLMRDERERHTESLNLVHEIELKVSEIHQKIESLANYVQEELGFTVERKHFAEENIFDLARAKEEIHILKGKIQNLGPVNQLAFEEYQDEKTRLDTLTFQRTDLLNAEQTLHDTIEEINKTAQEKFLSTFGLIRDNFIFIFKSLFEEGDEADLLLEEHVDPLEAAIEIIAKPRGKRPHSIEMLSGGEKTLTAIALLFAIYLVKPSPFCILDEVDAPLDDANIDRFIKIIRTFSDNTQFIIVTHNKRTMEAADTLYGVTMEEEGVSKLVAVRFEKGTVAEFSWN